MNDPYLEGKQAYQEGKPKSDNPYDDFDSNSTLWRAGWKDGQSSDEEYWMTYKKAA